MLDVYVPQHHQVGEITVQDIKRQEVEQDLTQSNWRYFHAIQATDSPNPGDDRRDTPPRSGSQENS